MLMLNVYIEHIVKTDNYIPKMFIIEYVYAHMN